MNKNLPKTPMIFTNGRRYPFRPECIICGLVADEPRPAEWSYKDGEDGGYICPHHDK